MGSGISEAMGSVDSIKNTMGGGDVDPKFGDIGQSAAQGPSKMGQFGKKALKGGLMGGAQGLQQQGHGQQRGGGGSMPQYIQGAMLPQIPGQSQQQVLPYGVNNPFFGG